MSPDPVATVEDTGSLAEHEAQFGDARARVVESPTEVIEPDPLEPEPTEPPAVETKTTPRDPRHRAASQAASVGDVETIAQLTKELHETEEALGLPIERKPGESQRVFNLRKRVAIAKAVRESRQQPPPSQVATTPPLVALATSPTDWTEAEPTIEQFADKTDPYGAWTRALASYDRRKEAFEAKQAEAKQTAEAAQKAIADHRKKIEADFTQRVKDYSGKNPDYEKDVSAVGARPTPVLLMAAIIDDPEGPRYIHALAKNSDLFDELFLLTDGKPPTPENVAVTQRRLKARILAAPTGSAASAPVLTAPRPPNPVRTGPIRPSETPPGDDSSIGAHESYFHPDRRQIRH